MKVTLQVLDIQKAPRENPAAKELDDFQKFYISLEISISDSGVGISKEGQDHLFVDFSRLDENQ